MALVGVLRKHKKREKIRFFILYLVSGVTRLDHCDLFINIKGYLFEQDDMDNELSIQSGYFSMDNGWFRLNRLLLMALKSG